MTNRKTSHLKQNFPRCSYRKFAALRISAHGNVRDGWSAYRCYSYFSIWTKVGLLQGERSYVSFLFILMQLASAVIWFWCLHMFRSCHCRVQLFVFESWCGSVTSSGISLGNRKAPQMQSALHMVAVAKAPLRRVFPNPIPWFLTDLQWRPLPTILRDYLFVNVLIWANHLLGPCLYWAPGYTSPSCSPKKSTVFPLGNQTGPQCWVSSGGKSVQELTSHSAGIDKSPNFPTVHKWDPIYPSILPRALSIYYYI